MTERETLVLGVRDNPQVMSKTQPFAGIIHCTPQPISLVRCKAAIGEVPCVGAQHAFHISATFLIKCAVIVQDVGGLVPGESVCSVHIYVFLRRCEGSYQPLTASAEEPVTPTIQILL
jgi:hypothetical protein